MPEKIKPLHAPFPWFGGKARVAKEIWERLGDPLVYVEPFAGSIACLLLRPDPQGPRRREIVCDTDGGICNFWRAIKKDPEGVAYYANYPTIHHDLTARHKWLAYWIKNKSSQLSEDPEYCDIQVAGWWVWGISIWIGSGWCSEGKLPNTRPHIPKSLGGQGVNRQRVTNRELISWFQEICQRLETVIVLNQSWEKGLTPALLIQTMPKKRAEVSIFMDPPYSTKKRGDTLYKSDQQGSSDSIAIQSFRWALDHGNQYRIVYCCHEGDFEIPDDWSKITRGFKGIGKQNRRSNKDLIAFSPACLPVKENECSEYEPATAFETPLAT